MSEMKQTTPLHPIYRTRRKALTSEGRRYQGMTWLKPCSYADARREKR